MSLELIKNNSNSIDFAYFNEQNSIFNEEEKKEEQFYDGIILDNNAEEIQKTHMVFDNKNNSDEEVQSISTSFVSENNIDNDEEALKLLPHNLLNIDENEFDFYLNEKKKKSIDTLNINSKPYIPKSKLFKIENKEFLNINNKKNNNEKIKKNKKKKKKFCEKEGDWTCYFCKNLNFSFRDVCNICKLSKIKSDKKYEEAFKALEELYNINNKNNAKKR